MGLSRVDPKTVAGLKLGKAYCSVAQRGDLAGWGSNRAGLGKAGRGLSKAGLSRMGPEEWD